MTVSLRKRINFGEIDGDSFTFSGIDMATGFSMMGNLQQLLPYRITESQDVYTQFLEEIPIDRPLAAQVSADATPQELREFRGGLGGVLWIPATRFELAHECSVLAGRVCELKVGDLVQLNKLIRKAKAFEAKIFQALQAKLSKVKAFKAKGHKP